MRRRLVLLLAAALAVAVAVVALLPYWLGPVARWAGHSRGLTFGAYERVGYTRFALRDVEFRRQNVRVAVSRVEADTPVVWLWRHWRARSSPVVAGTWEVETTRPTTPPPSPPDAGWVRLRNLLMKIGTQLGRWLPQAQTGAGRVRWPGGEISAASASWAGRELKVAGLRYRTVQADAIATFVPGEDLFRIKTTLPDDVAALALESRGPRVTGSVSLWGQPASLVATFAPRGWMPAEARLVAQEWELPGDRLKLGQAYARVRATAQVEWQTDRFVVDVTARGEPLPGRAAPPLEVVLRGRGDPQSVTIESLRATLPGVAAQLSEPVTIDRKGTVRENAARFAVRVDLAQLPWFGARGTAEGEARLVSGLAAAPVVDFSFAAREVAARDVALSAVSTRGRFAWPRLELAEATLTGGEGEQLKFTGELDLRAKAVTRAQVEGRLRRASIARWLPRQPEFDVVTVQAQAEGPYASVRHSGRVQAEGVKVPQLRPLAVSAQWTGAGADVERFEAQASVQATRLAVAGSVSPTGLQLTTLDFAQGGAVRLKLREPATVAWRPQIRLETLHLDGPDAALAAALTLGEQGRIDLSAKQITSRWFSDLLEKEGPGWQLTSLAVVGRWDRGPMIFSFSGGVAVEIGDGRTAAVFAAARGDRSGVAVEALRATEGEATVVSATGQIPVTFSPGAKEPMHIDPEGALRVEAAVAPNAEFWQKLAAMSGVELVQPQVSAHLSGTWRRPQGEASLSAAKVTIDPKRVSRPLPTIEGLDVHLVGDAGGVTLDRCTVRIEGQPIRAQGRLPVPDGRWAELFKEPLAAARAGADLRLEVPEAEIAVFARFLPAVLAPKGRILADLQYRQGGLEGFVRLRDAASKPLGPLGVLQEISADIALSGRKLALRGVTARSGGQPISLAGTVELPESGEPIFDLALRGENLPFVRQTGLLLRGDLDLKLQTPPNAVPRLSGTVKLRDSLFLSDVRAYLPKGGASASRRPPYFAVETPPVNTWQLAVDVVGERFMRLRMPVFTGVATARFRLAGTLGEPRATGEVSIDEGAVKMPFASFDVTQGSVRLTEADPFEPSIYLRATGRRFGYDLTMEVEGEASDPRLVFTSSPPLDSEQVLLMVMTGAAPSNEVNSSTAQRARVIGQFLGQSLLGNLWGDARDADRLTITSGEKISQQGRETLDIEYKLSDRLSITAERNEYDEYNGGVKWRVFRGERAKPQDANEKK